MELRSPWSPRHRAESRRPRLASGRRDHVHRHEERQGDLLNIEIPEPRDLGRSGARFLPERRVAHYPRCDTAGDYSRARMGGDGLRRSLLLSRRTQGRSRAVPFGLGDRRHCLSHVFLAPRGEPGDGQTSTDRSERRSRVGDGARGRSADGWKNGGSRRPSEGSRRGIRREAGQEAG